MVELELEIKNKNVKLKCCRIYHASTNGKDNGILITASNEAVFIRNDGDIQWSSIDYWNNNMEVLEDVTNKTKIIVGEEDGIKL